MVRLADIMLVDDFAEGGLWAPEEEIGGSMNLFDQDEDIGPLLFNTPAEFTRRRNLAIQGIRQKIVEINQRSKHIVKEIPASGHKFLRDHVQCINIVSFPGDPNNGQIIAPRGESLQYLKSDNLQFFALNFPSAYELRHILFSESMRTFTVTLWCAFTKSNRPENYPWIKYDMDKQPDPHQYNRSSFEAYIWQRSSSERECQLGHQKVLNLPMISTYNYIPYSNRQRLRPERRTITGALPPTTVFTSSQPDTPVMRTGKAVDLEEDGADLDEAEITDDEMAGLVSRP